MLNATSVNSPVSVMEEPHFYPGLGSISSGAICSVESLIGEVGVTQSLFVRSPQALLPALRIVHGQGLEYKITSERRTRRSLDVEVLEFVPRD